MLIYYFITDYQAFNLRYKDNTARDKNETKVGKQSANLGKNNEPIQNRLSFLIDCKSVILHHLAILSFPMVRPAWDNWLVSILLYAAIISKTDWRQLSWLDYMNYSLLPWLTIVHELYPSKYLMRSRKVSWLLLLASLVDVALWCTLNFK